MLILLPSIVPSTAVVYVPSISGPTPALTPGLYLWFGSNDRTFLLRNETIAYSKYVNQRWSGAFDLWDDTDTGTYRPGVGQQFVILENGLRLFAGIIDQFEESSRPGEEPARVYRCTLSGWASICDRRLVNQKYQAGTTVQAVMLDILANFLDGEGMYDAGIDGSDAVDQPLDFVGKTVAECFDTLRNLSPGKQWWVDDYKGIHFSAVNAGPAAPFTFQDGDYLEGTLKIKRTTRNFRNSQTVLTATNVVGSDGSTGGKRVENFTGDGTSTFFPSQFPITTEPTFTINGVAQTMHQMDVDPPGQTGWYWGPQFSGVTQEVLSPPAPGDALVLTYNSSQGNAVSQQDAASIAARAAIEGGSGIWATATSVNGQLTKANADATASGLLAVSGTIPTVITFDTDRTGLQIGMTLPCVLARNAINGNYTVQSIAARAMAKYVDLGYGSQIRYSVTVSDANDIGNYVKYFESLTRAAPGGGQVNPGATSGSSGQQDRANWFWNADTDETVSDGDSITNPYVVRLGGTLIDIVGIFDDPQVGCDLWFQVEINGVPIFPDDDQFVIPDGDNTLQTKSDFMSSESPFTLGDIVVQIGDILRINAFYDAGSPPVTFTEAKNGTVVLRWA